MSLPLSVYIDKKLRLQSFLSSFAISILLALVGGAVAFIDIKTGDETFAKSIAPHVAVLVETNDHIELQRFVSSLDSSVELDIVKDKKIIASTVLENVGKDAAVDSAFLTSSVLAKREGGTDSVSSVIVHSKIFRVVPLVLLLATGVFLLTMLLFRFIASQMSRTVRAGLIPVQQLLVDLQNISTEQAMISSNEFEIEELESIRTVLADTKRELNAAMNTKANSKAKELLNESYRRLIHDLHTPISALRQMVRNSNNALLDENTRAKCRQAVSELSDQILRQINSGKSNLSVEIQAIKTDLRATVSNAVAVSMAAKNVGTDRVKLTLPDEALDFAHDPQLISRAVTNLVVNAVEAANKVEVQIVRVNDKPAIRISDDGPGLDEVEATLHLQGRGISTKPAGLGLGISSANYITRAHGGKIVHRRASTGGAEFEIRL